MDTNDLIKCFGTVDAAKVATQTSRQLWDTWAVNGIPRGKQFEFEVLTGGKVKADRKFWTNGAPRKPRKKTGEQPAP